MAATKITTSDQEYTIGEAVTPDNSTDLASPARALYIGSAGNLKVDTWGGSTLTFTACPVGILRVSVKRVYATGTAASSIIALR